jgi:cellulose synthase/poly-beta-1,6-N-acetylglucosamine synthase-like glycosyltransferase
MDKSPFVSVIMPIRNESSYIARSLDAVLAQDYSSDRMEVIVVDGMSTDETRSIIQCFQARHPNIRLIDNPERIVSTGLNRALRECKGEIIIRVDGHCEVASGYVRLCVQHLRQGQVAAVGGPIETVGETFLAGVIALAMSSPFGVGGVAFRTVKNRAMFVETVAFPAYTRQAIERAGPFDEELVRNQDDEYNYRLRSLGCKILLSPEIRSRYYSRSSLTSLWRQYFQYGYWKVRVMQKHTRQMRLRQFVPPIFVAALLGLSVVAIFSPVGRGLVALLTGLYALANLTASIWTARKADWYYMLLAPCAFAVLHLSYGLGFFVGLVKFWNRWGDRRTKVSGESMVGRLLGLPEWRRGKIVGLDERR